MGDVEVAEETEQLGDWQTAETHDISETVNIWSEPTNYSSRMKELPVGTRLRCRKVIDDQHGEWYKVYSMNNEYYGYIQAARLKIE